MWQDAHSPHQTPQRYYSPFIYFIYIKHCHWTYCKSLMQNSYVYNSICLWFVGDGIIHTHLTWLTVWQRGQSSRWSPWRPDGRSVWFPPPGSLFLYYSKVTPGCVHAGETHTHVTCTHTHTHNNTVRHSSCVFTGASPVHSIHTVGNPAAVFICMALIWLWHV